MMETTRGVGGELRRAASFAFSAALHGAALGWIAIGASLLGRHAQSLYDQEIRPHETHIVWYGMRSRLPDVSPPVSPSRSRPLRATRKFDRQIVSRAKDNSRPPQMILAPAPEIRLPKPLPLPNILAVAVLPKAPSRAFVAPQSKPTPKTAPLPEAPPVPAATVVKDLPVSLPRTAPAVAFTPPQAKHTAAAAVTLPAAPAIAYAAPDSEQPRIVRAFTPPPNRPAAESAPNVPVAAPDPIAIAPAAATPALAVIGLQPVELPRIPPPPGSHDAGFSAGPKPRPSGSDADSKDAAVTASGLTMRGGDKDARAALMASMGSPTSVRNLMERSRPAAGVLPPGAQPSGALRQSTAPDPRLEGRAVYVMGIQMPNISSESGSWLVWFAERDGEPLARVELRSPVPIRKVDPKYIASARDERVEGAVRLFAVIRKTGAVDSIEVLKSIDPRLDSSAAEALAKWQFQPAMRDGAAIDVEAVFEIPFHLKPRNAR